MPLFYEIFDPQNEKHQNDAEVISGWTLGKHMIELTPAGIAAHVLGLIARLEEAGPPVGYRAVTQVYEADLSYEVGGLIVDPEMVGQGIGSQVAEELVEVAQYTFPLATLVVFCNDKSAPISIKHGFQPMPEAEVPPAALALCVECPMYAKRAVGQLCCDTILCLKPGATLV